MCFGSSGVVLFKWRDVEIVQHAGGVFNPGGKEHGSHGGTKGYIYSGSCDLFVQLVWYDNCDSYPAFYWLMNTNQPSLHFAQPPGTSWMRSLEPKFGTCGEAILWCPVSLLRHIPLIPLRPRASQSKLSSSQLVPTILSSNTATNTPSGGNSTCNWCDGIENTSLFSLRCV